MTSFSLNAGAAIVISIACVCFVFVWIGMLWGDNFARAIQRRAEARIEEAKTRRAELEARR